MNKFKALISDDQFFTFKGTLYTCKNGIFETDDKELIEFLKNNPNFQLIKAK